MGKIIAIIIILLLLVVAGLSAYLASYAVHGARYTLEETLDYERKRKGLRVSEAEGYSWEPFEVKSFDGYVLHGQIAMHPEPTDKFMIITHRYTLNRNGSLKYVPLFRDLGYNCVIYDDRGHGVNEPHVCTYSLKEGRDLMAVIRELNRRFGDEIYLGLHGESLGSATQIRALMYHPDVKFVVNDCGFAEIIPVMQGGLRGMHLPGFMVYLASLASRVMYGYAFTKARPIDALPGNTIPICFIHGAADDFITPDHSERMKEATAGYAELHLIPGAGHAMALETDPEKYVEIVNEFVKKMETMQR